MDSFLEYQNISGVIGTIVSSKLATLHELDTVYGLEDAYDLMEVLKVDAYNRHIISKKNQDH